MENRTLRENSKTSMEVTENGTRQKSTGNGSHQQVGECQLKEEEKAFIRSKVKRLFGFEESLKSAKSYFASAMLSLETFLTWSHDVTLPRDEQKNTNTSAFLATFESYEDILSFQRPIEPVVFQPVDYLSSKVKQRFQKGRKKLSCRDDEEI